MMNRVLAVSAAALFLIASHSSAATLTTRFVFNRNTLDGTQPSNIVRGGDGRIYGALQTRNTPGSSIAFRFDPQTDEQVSVLRNSAAELNPPPKRMVTDRAGNVYGLSENRLYRIDVATGALSYGASVNVGAYANLGCVDAAGNLYGTSQQGGTGNIGTLFVIRPGSVQAEVLASFDNSIGGAPTAGLVMDAGGNLYGATANGATAQYGTLFKWSTGSQSLSRLFTFNGTNGYNPSSPPTIDANGNLYGATAWGGAFQIGTLYRYSTTQNTFTNLTTFTNHNAGANAHGTPYVDAAGNLYGVTTDGGTGRRGAIYKLRAGTSVVTNLWSFSSAGILEGGFATGNLIAMPNGDLLGTTQIYANAHLGSIFVLSGAGVVMPEPTTLTYVACAMAFARRRRSR